MFPCVIGSDLELRTSGRADGTVEAVYIRLAPGQVARTVEVVEDILLVDLDAAGQALGLEILAPIPMARLLEAVDEPHRDPLRRFVNAAMPRTFLKQA